MKTEQRRWMRAAGWTPATGGPVAKSAQLVLVFGATAALQDSELVKSIRGFFPTAHIHIVESRKREGQSHETINNLRDAEPRNRSRRRLVRQVRTNSLLEIPGLSAV
jgi:hypothetical protein